MAASRDVPKKAPIGMIHSGRPRRVPSRPASTIQGAARIASPGNIMRVHGHASWRASLNVCDEVSGMRRSLCGQRGDEDFFERERLGGYLLGIEHSQALFDGGGCAVGDHFQFTSV